MRKGEVDALRLPPAGDTRALGKKSKGCSVDGCDAWVKGRRVGASHCNMGNHLLSKCCGNSNQGELS